MNGGHFGIVTLRLCLRSHDPEIDRRQLGDRYPEASHGHFPPVRAQVAPWPTPRRGRTMPGMVAIAPRDTVRGQRGT